jgi:SAM-dependent methyltransferase
MSVLQKIHGRWVHQRRVRVLARHLEGMLPATTRSVLDVGCGDGRLAEELLRLRPGLEVEGMDVMARPDAMIPVTVFDGRSLPIDERSVDAVILVDVLHHTEDPMVLLREAGRVARYGVAVKDHLLDGVLAKTTLTLMDWVGNASHGVALPYNYWRSEQWQTAFRQLGLHPRIWRTRLGLYPALARPLLDRRLHFLAFLESITPVKSPER